MNSSLTATCLFCPMALLGAGSFAAPQYVSSVIEPEGELRSEQHADLNGDGLQDLLLTVWSKSNNRELLVYLQEKAGRFPGKPSQRIDIKKDIVAYGLADLRDEPGEELLFLTRSAAYSYSTRKEGYADNLEKLFDWDLLTTVPREKSLAFFGRLQDYNSDGSVDILLPGLERYAVFYGDGEGGFGSPRELPQPYSDPERSTSNNIDVEFSDEEGLVFVVETPSPFAGLFPERAEPEAADDARFDRFADDRRILDVERWLASVETARMDDDDRADFIYVDDPEEESDEGESRRFNILYQAGDSAESHWQGTLASTGQLWLADFNNDGRDDLLALESRDSDQSSLRFFANREGQFDFQSADQVLRFSGYEVEAQFEDLNGDSQPELIVSYYSLAAMDALRSGSMLRTTLIYAGSPDAGSGGEEDRIFASRPTAKLEDKFSAGNVEGLAERPHFSADVTGNGRKEAVALDDEGALAARSIGQDLQVASKPVWRFVPLHLVQGLLPLALNTDESTDFLLRHQDALTVLVSQP